MAWIKPASTYPQSTSGIVSKNGWGGYAVLQMDFGPIRRVAKTTNGIKQINSATPTAGIWHHIAATYDGSMMKLYIDREKTSKITQSGTIVDSAQDHLFIAKRDGDRWGSAIDEVKIYNWALSAEEIMADYVAGLEDTIPPASISNLQNTTSTTWINWMWTNPLDTDFSHTKVYMDGLLQTNTSANYYNATSLTPNSSYEIGTHTVDTTGNVNSTWVNQTTITLTVPDIPPVADPNGPYTGMEVVPLQFNGNGSYDPDGFIVAYLWAFGDGNNATGATPTHTYAQNGTYTVTLTVTDNEGATDTSTTTADIESDLIPPYTTGHSPAKDAIEVDKLS